MPNATNLLMGRKQWRSEVEDVKMMRWNRCD